MEKEIINCEPGQIWQYANKSGTIRTVMLIACRDGYAAVLGLFYCPRPNKYVPVTVNEHVMFTDPGKLTYVFYTSLMDRIGDTDQAEFTVTKQAVKDALGLTDAADVNVYRELLLRLMPGLAEVLK